MKVALFGGSFDPVHLEHVRIAAAARKALGLDKVIVMPAGLAPHKNGAVVSAEERIAACKIAFRGCDWAEVSDFEARSAGKSYSYLTCRALREKYPDAERYFLVGADMLENFFSWKNPEEIVRLTELAACGREEQLSPALKERFFARFGREVREIAYTGGAVSSTQIRVGLAFRGYTKTDLSGMDGEVLSYLEERGLYRRGEAEALLLEKETRRAHSYRVALMACGAAKRAGVSEEKALLAAMLHDCGKYAPLSSPLLEGFRPPRDVPPPVLHQYTGAYLAEHAFGVEDGEVLAAIACHTSGREGMTALDALIYLSDLLEPSRDFEGVEDLRALFRADLFRCLRAALERETEYLKRSGKPIYPLTERACEWAKQTIKG